MTQYLIGQLESVGYRIDLLGESISVEGREARQLAGELRRKLEEHERDGRDFENAAEWEAGINKLEVVVEVELRHQLELIRDVVANLR